LQCSLTKIPPSVSMPSPCGKIPTSCDIFTTTFPSLGMPCFRWLIHCVTWRLTKLRRSALTRIYRLIGRLPLSHSCWHIHSERLTNHQQQCQHQQQRNIQEDIELFPWWLSRCRNDNRPHVIVGCNWLRWIISRRPASEIDSDSELQNSNNSSFKCLLIWLLSLMVGSCYHFLPLLLAARSMGRWITTTSSCCCLWRLYYYYAQWYESSVHEEWLLHPLLQSRW